MTAFRVESLRTPVFYPNQDLASFTIQALEVRSKTQPLLERTVIAITSKIVSLAENRLVPKNTVNKAELIRLEADRFLGDGPFGVALTIKHGLVIPSAGIDESNSENGSYILYPEHPYESASKLWSAVREHFHLHELGVILTDSHTHPLRRGVTGIGLAHWGFRATDSKVGQPDLFGRKLQFTHINTLDALACSAVYAMGEADECCPLALIEGAPVKFSDASSAEEIRIPLEEDLYRDWLV